MMRKSLTLIVSMVVLLCFAAPASATPAPAWSIMSLAAPTNFIPGDANPEHEYTYQVEATNIGAEATNGSPIKISDTLPAGLVVREVELARKSGRLFSELAEEACEEHLVGSVTTVTCTIDESLVGALQPAILGAGERMLLLIHVEPPSASGMLRNEAAVSGGGAGEVSVVEENPASITPASPGLSEFRTQVIGEDGGQFAAAAEDPYAFVTTFAMHTEFGPAGSLAALLGAGGDPKDIEVALPPGFIGDPAAAQRCTSEQFTTTKAVGGVNVNFCPPGSAVGVINVRQVEGRTAKNTAVGAVYNLVPPPGMPAQLGFQVFGAPIYINTAVRTGTDYGVTATLRNISQSKRITAASITLWGVPGSPLHDPLRGECGEVGGLCPVTGPTPPFLRLPSSCVSSMPFDFALDTWNEPGFLREATETLPSPNSCARAPFAPMLSAEPSSAVAESPTGLHVDLHIPQGEDPGVPATADLREAVVTLPDGLTVNPSSASGLEGCTPSQFGLTTPVGVAPIQTSASPAQCPPGSKIGTVEVDSPLIAEYGEGEAVAKRGAEGKVIPRPLLGGVYLAQPYENPFGSLLAIYIAVQDPQTGIVVKLAGHVEIGANGQLTTRFSDNPQLPFEDFKLDFFRGPQAALKTGPVCGKFSTTSSLTPWSAPESGPPATPVGAFRVTDQPGGGTCPTSADQQPNRPFFEAGSESPVAGAYSPFVLRLTRDDGTQQFSSLTVTPPPGLLGKLAGIQYCSDAALAAAGGKSGKEEQASASCPAASEVGIVNVGAGAGPSPFYVQGRAYLAGPYKDAPLSLAIITPAVAGPYDLGTVVVRSALEVNPFTSQITVKSDQIPTELKGIPLDVRSIAVKMDRSNFTLNPTSCEAMLVGGSMTSTVNQTVTLINRFQAGSCGNLGFKPKLKIALKGSTTRTGHPALKAVLTYPKAGAYANVRRAQVNLPHSEFIEQNNLNKTCTKPVLLEGKCPKSTIYGKAKAWTPLLDHPLEGNVYLVGGFGYKLPALVAELNGQIRILLAGKVDSGPNKGIRNTFEAVPDAPVEKFELNLKGGPRYSLLVNSENLCKKPQKAIARFTAQNGKVLQTKPVIANSCKKKPRGGGKKPTDGHHKKGGSGHQQKAASGSKKHGK